MHGCCITGRMPDLERFAMAISTNACAAEDPRCLGADGIIHSRSRQEPTEVPEEF